MIGFAAERLMELGSIHATAIVPAAPALLTACSRADDPGEIPPQGM
jgi:hypothetical protein